MVSNNFLTPIQAQLFEVEKLMLSQADSHHPDLAAALHRLLDSGGKRIRPALALLTGGMLNADPQRLVILAAAIELLHTATLVHDDLIDGAFIRRGNATLNSQWSPAATVLTGDFIFAQAARLAAETESVTVMRLFADTLATIVNGEIIQMFSGHGMVDRRHYEQRIYAKTASLFETAARSAAMLSPVDRPVIEQMRSYGYSIGMAFQIVDDVLDLTGEQVTVGKPVASDLRQGLITLPVLYYWESFPDNREMKAILEGNHTGETEINRLIAGIRESGSIHKAMDTANGFIENGLQALKFMPDNLQRSALESLANYIVDRQL
jgi:geranylgeranyl pyrophosphate synthase